jgi:Bacterial regulatory proteins, lacI family
MPTIHEVAKHADVGSITVSRVINNSAYISLETRERVQKAIVELGYVPNILARSFMYIDECVFGIDQIMHCDRLIATPINLGTNELVSINHLVDYIEEIETSGIICVTTRRKLAATIAVSYLIIVDTPDALLVCNIDREQDVRTVVRFLESGELQRN